MASSRLELDEAATLMMAVCKELKVKHRVMFTGIEVQGASQILYEIKFQVSEAGLKSEWLTIDGLGALVVWLAEKG